MVAAIRMMPEAHDDGMPMLSVTDKYIMKAKDAVTGSLLKRAVDLNEEDPVVRIVFVWEIYAVYGCVCMYVCIHMYVCRYIVCVCVCRYIYVYVYVYVCIYIYIYTLDLYKACLHIYVYDLFTSNEFNIHAYIST